MAHNLNFHNGKASYYGRESAWTKLGTVTGHYMTWAEIQSFGGLNFVPVKRQLTLDGQLVDAWGIVRPDTGAFLGQVGKDYTVIDHAQGFLYLLFATAHNGTFSHKYMLTGTMGPSLRVVRICTSKAKSRYRRWRNGNRIESPPAANRHGVSLQDLISAIAM